MENHSLTNKNLSFVWLCFHCKYTRSAVMARKTNKKKVQVLKIYSKHSYCLGSSKWITADEILTANYIRDLRPKFYFQKRSETRFSKAFKCLVIFKNISQQGKSRNPPEINLHQMLILFSLLSIDPYLQETKFLGKSTLHSGGSLHLTESWWDLAFWQSAFFHFLQSDARLLRQSS